MKSDYLPYIDYEFDQTGCTYKVNTDTVALGMFLDPMKHKSVLDIGTNSGALLLYAHEKGADKLIGVDIHEDALGKQRKRIFPLTAKILNCIIAKYRSCPSIRSMSLYAIRRFSR